MRFDKTKKLVQLIHIGKAQLGFDDELYRDLIEAMTGKTSTTQLTVPQLEAVLDRLKQLGFAVKKTPGVKNLASDDQSRLIRHLWLILHAAGEVRNPSELALANFIQKQTGISALQFLSTDSASKVIERLKQWCKRKHIEIK